ncbi:hypothetical protein BGZ73_009207 [Actinomortierella ambigua]|nr:hypothetical protein BGZ73_009207 [Actinomortierella ambigua]
MESNDPSLQLHRLIGKGGFGSVYYGTWNTRRCAVKKLTLTQSDYESRFKNEISILQNLHSRYVIQFYGAPFHNGTLCIAMDYAEGGSLAEAIHRGMIDDWATKRQVADEVARGLAYIHSQGVLHRDLKSSNVLLTKHMEAKLCDFGLAQIKALSSRSSAYDVNGTLRWMAPELFSPKPKYSTKSDIYALGVTLWEMAANSTKPFAHQNNNAALAMLITKGARDEIPDNVPSFYRSWIERCWDHDPAKRPEAHEIAYKIAPESEILSLSLSTSTIDYTSAIAVTRAGSLYSVEGKQYAGRSISATPAMRPPDSIYDIDRAGVIGARRPKTQMEDDSSQEAPLATHAKARVPMSFTLGDKVGSGAHGTVFRAQWGNIQCAAKSFNLEGTRHGKSLIQRELETIERLRHPNVIQFYKIIRHEGKSYLLMELAANGSLEDFINKKQLKWTDKTRIAHEIARGLEYIHSKGILHRDLKSADVLLDQHLVAKLCDFGAPENRAQALTHSVSRSAAAVVNTVRWMAPELFEKNPRYSTKSDMYAFGMVMWAMAADCTRPFRDTQTEKQVIDLVTEGKREILPDDTPSKFRACVRRCWKHDPARRPEAHDVILSVLSEESMESIKPLSVISISLDFDQLPPTEDFNAPHTTAGASHNVGEDESDLRSLMEESPAKVLLTHASCLFTPIEAEALTFHPTSFRSQPFKLSARIGINTYGSVYSARWQGGIYAAKIFTFAPIDLQEASVREEIDAIQRLRHRHIIPFRGAYFSNSHLLLFMDFVSKGSLAALISRTGGWLDWPTKMRLADEISQGLIFLHENGVLHRRLKSANVLLSTSMDVKLSDYGLTKIHELGLVKMRGHSNGHVRWCAPELLSIQPEYSTKSDMYAFGMVMWEMAANSTLPFPNWEGDEKVMEYVLTGGREVLPTGTPLDFETWINRCWSHNPAERPEAADVRFASGKQRISNTGFSEISDSSFQKNSVPEIHSWRTDGRGTLQDNTHASDKYYHEMTAIAPVIEKVDLSALQVRAASGNIDAQLKLAAKYETGDGVAQSREQALTLYRKAAAVGNAQALYRLGSLYFSDHSNSQSNALAASWYRRAAEQGHADAQVNLAMMFLHGLGVERSEDMAAVMYRKAATQGLANAQFSLGWMYATGKGVEQNYSQAATWYQMAAEQGHADAQANLAVLYCNGQGVLESKAEATEWFRKAAIQGHPKAQFSLGWMYFSDRSVEPNYLQATVWYRKAAQQGHADAQFSLGWMYSKGLGVEQSDDEAVTWFRLAAMQGHSDAQLNFGMMYANGRGVKEDHDEAFEWYRKAANQGNAEAQFCLGQMYEGEELHSEAATWYRMAAEQEHPNAQFSLGRMYVRGLGVGLDHSLGAKWYLKASEQGHASAQLSLGWMYANGIGVSRNDAEAVSWYRKASDQGNPNAQFSLGWMYAYGRGVNRDSAEAVSWYRKASEHGHAEAQFKLGEMYAKGRGVKRDDVEAISWYDKASEQGHLRAQIALEEMYDKGQGIKRADVESSKWFSKAAKNMRSKARRGLGLKKDVKKSS